MTTPKQMRNLMEAIDQPDLFPDAKTQKAPNHYYDQNSEYKSWKRKKDSGDSDARAAERHPIGQRVQFSGEMALRIRNNKKYSTKMYTGTVVDHVAHGKTSDDRWITVELDTPINHRTGVLDRVHVHPFGAKEI